MTCIVTIMMLSTAMYIQLFVTQHASMGDVRHLIHAHATTDGKGAYVNDVMLLININSLCTSTISKFLFQQFAIHLVFMGPAQLQMLVHVT